jgi:hypothetical protein
LPKWDYKIDEWIVQALRKNERLGRNEIYRYIDERYKKARHKTKSLSKEVFDEHLTFLKQNGVVGTSDVEQRGIKIEHFLTPEAIQQLQTGTLDLRALKNQKKQDKQPVKKRRQMKFKALYILILMFNHTTSFEIRNKDELISFLAPFHLKLDNFLAPFHLKLDKPSIERLANEHECEEVKIERTRIESQDGGVTVSIYDYVNRYHGGITSVYKCMIRGMTKETVNSNRNVNPFQYLSITSNQLDEVFDHLCKDQLLRPLPHPDAYYIYRIVDNNLYFLLFFLEDLFTEYVMPVMRKIWKYLRNPTPEERQWLTILYGDETNKIIIEYNEHRHELENETRKKAQGIETVAKSMLNKKKINTINEIEEQVKSIQEDLDSYQQTYDFLIKKHFSLQQILEIMFPEFLKHLELRRSDRNHKES